ncbi:hypothetical protein KO494_00930 [Lacinutrix sp. C3R15]|uniref:hypothetical protein n=1 Tax=Flavobacteriaceae TaxID=49546 RepID=UPI001C089EE0|nr:MULTISPECIES: hypothetical protein [Flavobacteriaceae]MBU2938090.1 hypothetical protein [Lacinutrix sp. C3R15]MDO6621404.1 hypothetical protein [Oceanihabitans sp. 1_MG-2023]
MSFIKTAIVSLLTLFFMASFLNCSSIKDTKIQDNKLAMQDFQENTSFTLDQSFYKYWVAGVKGGGSGIHLQIVVTSNPNNVVFDSVYFRGMQSALEPVKTGYVANFNTKANQKEVIILSNEKNAEYGNQLPNNAAFPFQLKDNECVISYIEDAVTKYFKIENLAEKPRDQYPSAPPKH